MRFRVVQSVADGCREWAVHTLLLAIYFLFLLNFHHHLCPSNLSIIPIQTFSDITSTKYSCFPRCSPVARKTYPYPLYTRNMRVALQVAAIAALTFSTYAVRFYYQDFASVKADLLNDSLSTGLPTESPDTLQEVAQYIHFRNHHISTLQETAAEYITGHFVPLTDAQIDAIVLAGESTREESFLESTDPIFGAYADAKRHAAHVFKVMDAGFSLEDVRLLFHGEYDDNRSVRFSDEEIDTAISSMKECHAPPQPAPQECSGVASDRCQELSKSREHHREATH